MLALGNFDGLHRGHQALIAKVRAIAIDTGKPSGVLLLEPHPRAFFKPNEPYFQLMSLEEKLEVLDDLGLDLAVVLPFGAELSGLTATEFISDVLVDGLGVSHVVVGYHYFFGKARSGTVETLREAGLKAGFGVTVLDPVSEAGDVFSSTAIRLKLAEGNVRAAADALGRPWRVIGPVVGGAKRGTGMGFPTANVPMRPGTTLGHGIYAVRVRLEGQDLKGAAYLGTRPTFDNGAPVLEVFLFDFDGDLYGKTIEVSFIEKIRGDRKFSSAEDLIVQMDADCRRAREILGS